MTGKTAFKNDVDEVAVYATAATSPQLLRYLAQPEFRWTRQKLVAAYWVADGMRGLRQIADEVGVTLKSLYYWTKRPEFIAQVNDYRLEITQRVLDHGISGRERRIRVMDDIVERQLKLIQRRGEQGAADPNAEPGEETGLLVEEMQGKVPMMVYDAALTREIRENLKYVSQELGQFQEKVAVTQRVETIEFTIPMGPRQLRSPSRGVVGPNGVEWIEGETRELPEGVAESDADYGIEGFGPDDGDEQPMRGVEREMGDGRSAAGSVGGAGNGSEESEEDEFEDDDDDLDDFDDEDEE